MIKGEALKNIYELNALKYRDNFVWGKSMGVSYAYIEITEKCNCKCIYCQIAQPRSIDMDKYKTSELGKALKKVFRGEMSVKDSVSLAEQEISAIFKKGGSNAVASDVDTGKFGEIVGVCPVCKRNVVRGKTSYGCMGYNDGCNFRVGVTVCKKNIPISEVRKLLSEGSTSKMSGFISKTGKLFDGRLVIKDGTAVFNFD